MLTKYAQTCLGKSRKIRAKIRAKIRTKIRANPWKLHSASTKNKTARVLGRNEQRREASGQEQRAENCSIETQTNAVAIKKNPCEKSRLKSVPSGLALCLRWGITGLEPRHPFALALGLSSLCHHAGTHGYWNCACTPENSRNIYPIYVNNKQ